MISNISRSSARLLARHSRQGRLVSSSFSSSASEDSVASGSALVIGAYKGGKLTPTAERINQLSKGALARNLSIGFKGEEGSVRQLYAVEGVESHDRILVVGLGEQPKEPISGVSSVVRSAAGAAVKLARSQKVAKVEVEDFEGQQEAAGQGAVLAKYRFEDLKSRGTLPKDFSVSLHPDASGQEAWTRGTIVASSQNLARHLAELPSNHMTPTMFCERVESELKGLENVSVVVHDREWCQSKGMGAFLGVAQGSDEAPRFLELRYNGNQQEGDIASSKPIVLVGKGITFDSGGISIKPAAEMGWMRGDMGGAAAVVSAFKAAAALKLPINLVALTPLCENMVSGHAIKPADVLRSAAGLTIEVDNTDAEGRLILADALWYAQSGFNPSTLIDVATLTGAIDVALGGAASGAFVTSDALWKELDAAGQSSDDHFWRMPLFKEYSKQIKSNLADLKNVGGRSAGACTAAAFLKEFVKVDRWAHLDIAGVAWTQKELPHMSSGMTGRPVRALVDFLRLQSPSQ